MSTKLKAVQDFDPAQVYRVAQWATSGIGQSSLHELIRSLQMT